MKVSESVYAFLWHTIHRVFLLPVTHTEVSQNCSTLKSLLCDPFYSHTNTHTHTRKLVQTASDYAVP